MSAAAVILLRRSSTSELRASLGVVALHPAECARTLQPGDARGSHTEKGRERVGKQDRQPFWQTNDLLVVKFIFGKRDFAEHGMDSYVFVGNNSSL